MRRISIGVEQLTTAAPIADAVLTYAAALGRANTSDTITIPIVRGDGEPDQARLLLGPASQITIVPVDRSDTDGEVDPSEVSAVIADLEQRTAHLEPGPIPNSPAEEADEAGQNASFTDFDHYR